jgi:hypothetical protein
MIASTATYAARMAGEEIDPFSRLCQLLRSIDEVHAGQSGRFSFGNDQEGVILMQEGRVCWAASPAMTSRLIHRLTSAGEYNERELRLLFHECRQSGKPFGQTLVERGIVTLPVLRGALLKHTAEAMAGLARCPASPRWIPASIDGYDVTLTFTTAELLTQAADVWWGPLAVAARAELELALSGRNVVGLAFLPIAAAAEAIIPVGVRGADTMRVREILAIGNWARGLLRSCDPIAGRLIGATRKDGRTSLVWSSQGACYVTFGSDAAEMAFVVAHLSRRPAGD